MAVTKINQQNIKQAWARDTWKAGIHKAYFDKFTGKGADSIMQIKEELQKEKGDKITIPLLMPLKGAGVTGDNMLEGNEESLIYKSFDVSIDQYRNAVRIAGKMEEQKTQINMRIDARNALSDWLATKIDKMVFTKLSTNPSDDRVVYGGTANSASALKASDTFNADLIGVAKRIALADEDTMVKPLKVNGSDTYVMVIDQYQARDLMHDEKFLEAQKYANVRGDKNPIFSGALGIYDGVVIHQCNRVIRDLKTNTTTPFSHALFMGAQAAVMAVGTQPTWSEDDFDYGNQTGFAFGRIFGIEKAQYDYDGDGKATDFGVINIITATPND